MNSSKLSPVHLLDPTLKRTPSLVKSPVAGVKRKIQFKHVHTRLAQKTPLPIHGLIANQLRDFRFWYLAFRRYAPNLELCRRG
jgi:hypothetical protein